jgi:hypothetical protein
VDPQRTTGRHRLRSTGWSTGPDRGLCSGLDANGSFSFALYPKGKIDAMAFAFKNNDYDQFAADGFKFRIAKAP